MLGFPKNNPPPLWIASDPTKLPVEADFASWCRERERLEREASRTHGIHGTLHDPFAHVIRSAHLLLQVTGLYRLGRRNAIQVSLRHLSLTFPELPPAFDGMTILHLTDPHFDAFGGMVIDPILTAVNGLKVDLCVITGDFCGFFFYVSQQVVDAVARLAQVVESRHGFFATLGNHDSIRLVEPLSDLGCRVLGNEHVMLRQGDEFLHITGLDDVEVYRTDAVDRILSQPPPGFKIMLVHSPGVVRDAAKAGYNLYLCGHTHGGQISLPGGRPIAIRMPHQNSRFVRGLWHEGNMRGFTSTGCGISLLPVRFNAAPEVTLLTLNRKRLE